MPRPSHILQRLLLTGTLLLACGCGSSSAVADAGAEAAVPQQDAQPSEDAPRVVADGGCSFEFQACDGDAGACGDPALDCVHVGVNPTKNALCLRRCVHTEECPFSAYCVPSDSTRIHYAGLLFAAGHCYESLCGLTYGNGRLFEACKVGGDSVMVDVDQAEQRPGTCIPLDSDGGTGACSENAGDGDGGTLPAVGRDEPCTASPVLAGCVPRARVTGCGLGMICAGPQDQPDGLCRQLCDPTKAAPSDPSTCTPGPYSPVQWCQDSSSMFRGASGTIRVGYVGFCQELQGCNLFPAPADGGAPASDCPDGQGCLPTTIVNPSGVCFTAAPLLDGGVPPETCASATDCSAGALCVSQGTSTTSSCLPLCAPGSDSNGCATGQTCEGVAYEPLFPDMQSSSWGVCAPNARGSSPITP